MGVRQTRARRASRGAERGDGAPASDEPGLEAEFDRGQTRARRASRGAERGDGAPASDEPGFGAAPRIKMDFEYVIKRDVRNNPIVRELDEARQRELWRSAAIATFLVVVVLFSAFQHFELLRHGYRIERMQQEKNAEEEIQRHLRLEIETLRAPARIERVATQKLKLVTPKREEAIVIERVTAPAPPGRSIVAAR